MQKTFVSFSRLLSICLIISLLGTTAAMAQGTTECKTGFRLFSHKLLGTPPVCIPEDPQRIVVMDMSALELLLLTDKNVVGAYDSFKDELMVLTPSIADKVAAVPNTGLPPNLETITSWKPDLIVVDGGPDEYAAFSPIAPTITLTGDTFTNNWQRSTEFWGEVFNLQDVYQKMFTAYQAKVTELQQALGEDRSKLKVSMLSVNPGWLGIWMLDSAQGKILQDVGLGRPDSQSFTEAESTKLFETAGYETISEETLNLADGDVLFMFPYAASDAETVNEITKNFDDFLKNPLVKSLNVVRNDHAYVVGAHWFRGFTYLQANLILDDLFKYVAHAESKMPDPLSIFEK